MNGNRASRRYMPIAGKMAHHPKKMRSGDNAIIGIGLIGPATMSSCDCDDDLSRSVQYMSADTQNKARQNAFSFV
jgi:hypothetical protein